MPPPIEEQEEAALDEESSSERSSSDETTLSYADVPINPSQSAHSRVSPGRVVSDDIPLVTCDIQPTTEMAAPRAVSREVGKRDTSMKRKSPPKRSNYEVLAKRRKGDPRALPCIYCARRLANDPKWGCQDALVSQDGKPGYTGMRCDECVGSHVSCCPIPLKAVAPVKALMKAAEEVNKHEGGHNVAVLAAYEAAIEPALRAMVDIGLQSSAKVNEPKKRKRPPRNKKRDSDARGPSERRVAVPQASRNPSQFAESSGQTIAGHHGGGSQRVHPGQVPLSGPVQSDYRRGTPNMDSSVFEKAEMQALRRRKVDALESLAHTAALFLAEFMDFKRARQEPPPGPQQQQQQQQHQRAAAGAGEEYAAAAAAGVAAASLFRPLDEEIERNGYSSSGSEAEQGSTDYGSDDDEDVPAEMTEESKDDMDVEDRESHGTLPDLLASLRDEERTGVGEPGVKVEEH